MNERLAERTAVEEYKEIGLTPEQLKEVDRLYTEKCKELSNVLKELERYNAVMKKQGNIKELFTLIKNNPDLPIVAYVDSDIVADCGYNRWLASVGSSHVIEYAKVDKYGYGEMELVYKDDVEEYERYLYENTSMTDSEIKECISNLNWIKAIAVNIDLPEL